MKEEVEVATEEVVTEVAEEEAKEAKEEEEAEVKMTDHGLKEITKERRNTEEEEK